ncbi:hypothetical protein HI914_06483 [Erysiphe necator]|nr:hypothetical protein HI914_06483 [Erysiphe necator]
MRIYLDLEESQQFLSRFATRIGLSSPKSKGCDIHAAKLLALPPNQKGPEREKLGLIINEYPQSFIE